MSTTDEQLKNDFTKKEKIIMLFLCAISIAGIIDGLFFHLLKAASEKIALSGGLALSFYSVYLMAESKKIKQNGQEFDSHVALTPKRYKWGKRGVFIGFLFQLFGIWLNIFEASFAVASTPLVKNLPEAGETSLIDKILNDPSLIIASLALIATVFIAYASWRSVRTAKKTMQGNLYIRFIEEYASAEMCRALRLLKEAHKNILERDERLDIETNNFKTSRLADPDTVEEARRLVKYYFFKALRLKKLGFFSEKLMKEVGSVAGINILYDIVKKYETDPKAKSTIEEISKICGRYDEGGDKG